MSSQPVDVEIQKKKSAQETQNESDRPSETKLKSCSQANCLVYMRGHTFSMVYKHKINKYFNFPFTNLSCGLIPLKQDCIIWLEEDESLGKTQRLVNFLSSCTVGCEFTLWI